MNLTTFGASIGLATATAVGVYKFAADVAKDASPTAKRDIGIFLATFTIPSDLSLVIRHLRELFEIAFGRRHLSLRCAIISFLVTAGYFVFFGVLTYLTYFRPLTPPPVTPHSLTATLVVRVVPYQFALYLYAFAFSLIPDYLSLAKGRYVLRCIEATPQFWSAFRWVCTDIILSLIIGIASFVGMFFILYLFGLLAELTGLHPDSLLGVVYTELSFFLRILRNGSLYVAIFFSTLVTSVWIVLIVVSALLLRGLGGSANSILRLIRWLFPISERPVEACGAASAIIVWIAFVLFGLAMSFLQPFAP
jgi:hypothetical protein